MTLCRPARDRRGWRPRDHEHETPALRRQRNRRSVLEVRVRRSGSYSRWSSGRASTPAAPTVTSTASSSGSRRKSGAVPVSRRSVAETARSSSATTRSAVISRRSRSWRDASCRSCSSNCIPSQATASAGRSRRSTNDAMRRRGVSTQPRSIEGTAPSLNHQLRRVTSPGTSQLSRDCLVCVKSRFPEHPVGRR